MRFERVKVVEYLVPSMAKELLGKFPDNSAFDFDYSQSSIWSPLVTRAYSPANDSEFDLDFLEPKKLDFPRNERFSLKKITSNLKKKKIRTTSCFALNLSATKLKNTKTKKKKMISDLSPGSSSFRGTCNPVTKTVCYASFV